MSSTVSTGKGGEGGTYPWTMPRCLIENSNGNLIINQETVKLLEKIANPVVVVSVVGLYRTGKSYLMNRLAGKQKGFAVGNTVQAMTKGIWIWCVAHPNQPNYHLLLLDTEGLSDVEKGDSQNDTVLFLLATLLSSTLIYNSRGSIDNDAIDKLHFATVLAERVKIDKGQADLTAYGRDKISEYFPTFVWTVRDFQLDLQIEGHLVTADEYLEHILKEKPAELSMLSNLDTLTDDELDQVFSCRMKEFTQYVYTQSKPKLVEGTMLDGQKFAILVMQYIESMKNGGTPCIKDVHSATANAVNSAALKECIEHYVAAMTTVPLPTADENTLRIHDTRCKHEAKDIFLKRIITGYEKEKFEKDFENAMDRKYADVSARNQKLSEEKCRAAIEKCFQPIQNKIGSGVYIRSGGYSEYREETAAAFRAYQNIPGKGVKAATIEQEYVSKFSATEKMILDADKKLSGAGFSSSPPTENGLGGSQFNIPRLYSIVLNSGTKPTNAAYFEPQKDGNPTWLVVAHTTTGDIPGKKHVEGPCFYPIDGKSGSTDNFSWITAPHGVLSVKRNEGRGPPSNAVIGGFEHDGDSGDIPSYSVVAYSADYGHVPGKYIRQKCSFEYCGFHEATDWYWVVYPVKDGLGGSQFNIPRVYSIVLNSGTKPTNAAYFEPQKDGNPTWLVVAHTTTGDIPGKKHVQGPGFYPIDGKSGSTDNFSWITAPHGVLSLKHNEGRGPPSNAVIGGFEHDRDSGDIPSYSVVAYSADYGHVPGKYIREKCSFEYCGFHEATDWYWVVYPIKG